MSVTIFRSNLLNSSVLTKSMIMNMHKYNVQLGVWVITVTILAACTTISSHNLKNLFLQRKDLLFRAIAIPVQ